MINSKKFLDRLKENEFDYFSGVPDSTFKELITEITLDSEVSHRIAANECEAISLASGYHLATEKIGITYMQNSGFGKIVNPLTSLLSKDVYSIPTVLFIGYRGEPGKKDEPQHKMMGKKNLKLLEILEIKYEFLPDNLKDAIECVKKMRDMAVENKYATAIIIKKGLFKRLEKNTLGDDSKLGREESIKIILENITEEYKIISTTGKTSRELFEQRIAKSKIPNDFLTVGSMGCSSSIACEIAMQKNKKKIICLDGDGAAIMQMGSFATIGSLAPKNFIQILFDNNSYDSTGGQKTNSDVVDFEGIAKACNYKYFKTISNKNSLITELKNIDNIVGPILLVIEVKKGARSNLGRPTKTPIENKTEFMNSLK